VEADGFRIRYREAGQGHPVVILDAMTWGLSDLHDRLAQTYRVVALELPGFGQSQANTTSQSVQDLARTAARAIASLVPDPYTLIGTSFAAHVALWQTLQAPDQVEALILISPTALQPVAPLWTGAPQDLARHLLAHADKSTRLSALDPARFAKEQALVQRLQGFAHDAEAESKLGEIACATLVVFGSKDRLVASEAASIYRAQIPNCNLSLVYDTGHVIVAERPEALISLVADYVERRETFIVGRQNRMIHP
jgi:pimeloyl-ACP methyl ester carboxylesterase